MKTRRIFLSICLLLGGIACCYSQKYMVVKQKGDKKSKFLIETIDSVCFDGYDEDASDLNSGSDEYSPTYVSSFLNDRQISYNDVAFDNNNVYAVGNSLLQVIDWSDDENPVLKGEIDLDPTGKLKCRSVTYNDDYIYVGLRSTLSGTAYPVLPHTRLQFETRIDKYEEKDSISDNYLFNQIFKKLHIESYDATTTTKIYVYKCMYEAGVYRNVIRFNHLNGTIAFVSKNFTTQEECIASLTSTYKTTKGDSCVVNWDAIPGRAVIFNNNVTIKNANGDNDGLFSNQLLNKFFQRIHIGSISINEITKCYVYKAYYEKGVYRNIIKFQTNDGNLTFIRNDYQTKEDALDALEERYSSIEGDECIVDWNALNEGQALYLTNLSIRKIGFFDDYSTDNGAVISEIKDGCPGVGNYSALLTTNESSLSSAYLQKELDGIYDSGSISLWIKNNNTIARDVKIPFLFYNGESTLALILTPNSSGYSIGIETPANCITSGIGMLNSEWYNIKVEIHSDNLILSYRSKECGLWNVLLNTRIKELRFNALGVGIETENQSANINMDDVFFSTSNVDEEAFICGKLVVLDKRNLSVLNTYNLDMKGTDICIEGNTLIFDMLKGCNIYDISNPSMPKLKYWHRSNIEKYKEYQGCRIFNYNERVYSVSSNYHLGITILDITDMDNVKEVYVNNFSDLAYNGNVLSGKSYNFDVEVHLPYIYLTHTTFKNLINTDFDYRGLVVVDITDMQNIKKKVIPAPLDIWTTIYNGDPKPNRIKKVGNRLILNNNDRGVVVYDISNPAEPVYLENIEFPVKTSINTICPTGNGNVIFGDDGTSNKSFNLYKYKGF